jgi:hypothetical protein
VTQSTGLVIEHDTGQPPVFHPATSTDPYPPCQCAEPT